jgi:hypothetical protein
MTATPALDWLYATFDARRRKAVDHDFRIGPMITLKSGMDPGQPMHIRPGDYDDPLWWWR